MFNLLHEYWIPVITRTGRRLIRPFDIVDPAVLWPDWPRADLNVACLELLIGMVAMADPPRDPEDWDARRRPDAARWAERLGAFADAFALDGPGPRFMQDLEPFEVGVKQPGSVDMLFIDSAGANATPNNTDLMVHRGRYADLSMGEAAMALFTLQAYAPEGGRGYLTSLRAGGPLSTLVVPGGEPNLFDVIWANVPDGRPGNPDDLPWMKQTRASKVYPPAMETFSAVEVFFGMPRRIRLIFSEDRVVGVEQRQYGNKYEGWVHPLSPYYRNKAGEMAFCQRAATWNAGYRNWLGVVCQADDAYLRDRALALRQYDNRADFDEKYSVLVSGWATNSAKILDFVWSREPTFVLSDTKSAILRGVIRAAEVAQNEMISLMAILSGARRKAELKSKGLPQDYKPSDWKWGGSCESNMADAFYVNTEAAFLEHMVLIRQGISVGETWLAVLRDMVLNLFNHEAARAFTSQDAARIHRALFVRERLLSMLGGYSKSGVALYEHLRLEPPKPAARPAKAKGIAA
ncbi:type I-E CRISPR-associated protein Cse1/CasA [Novosphingobium sp. FSW06-99]|uniref:type I-E CRISPR-associated protein Cse1/CasA n=1 Tax=Novosphingobium sp. FSW06-99 TaxID=1739113 RepID=UPI0009EAD318|nr:type I-E CRISPR-associated protein Cse1/CasA [Novosphingobium sp. FSW06-99]